MQVNGYFHKINPLILEIDIELVKERRGHIKKKKSHLKN